MTGNTALSPIPLSRRARFTLSRKNICEFHTVQWYKNLSLSLAGDMRAKRITICPLIVREQSFACTFTKFLPVPLGESRGGWEGEEGRRDARGRCRRCTAAAARGVSAVVLPGVRTHTGALMHIGIVANAPGRKKKMNREALLPCGWLCAPGLLDCCSRVHQSVAGAICRARRL